MASRTCAAVIVAVTTVSCAAQRVDRSERSGLGGTGSSATEASAEVGPQTPARSEAAPAVKANGSAELAESEPAPWEPSYTSEPTGPVHRPELLARRAEAQARILGRGSELEDALGKPRPPRNDDGGHGDNGNALGEFVPIENEAALRPFHMALRRLENGALKGGKLRILAYGASHTQADVYPGYLRYYLQSRFGDGGPGFFQMAAINQWHRPLDLTVSSQGFTIQHAQKNRAQAAGLFGLLGAAAVADSPMARATLRPRKARSGAEGPLTLEVFAMGQTGGGGLTLEVDGAMRETWSTRSEPPRPLVFAAQLDAGWTEVQVRPAGNGSVRLFGAALERATPGIVVDTLGISGTRAANWLHWNESAWTEQVARRHPHLVTLAYGTNESADEGQPIERYESDLGEVLARLRRAAPEASCVLLGPGDSSKKDGDSWVPRRRLGAIIEVQRRQALKHGCGFWDTRRFMGKGGIGRWVRAVPAMAAGDRLHLTQRGYAKLGLVFGDALMRAYDAAAPDD